jgi:hypothetical protein
MEFSGIATSGSLDGVGSQPAQGNNTGDPESFAAISGYTIVESIPAQPGAAKLIAEYQLQGTAGSTTASATLGTADNWATGSGNMRMMYGYLDNGNGGTTKVTVSGLPVNINTNGYTVYVYADGSTTGYDSGIYQIIAGTTTTSTNLEYSSL